MELESKDLIFVWVSIIFIVSLTFTSGKYLQYKNDYLELKNKAEGYENQSSRISKLSERLDNACTTIKALQDLNNSLSSQAESFKSNYIELYSRHVSNNDRYIKTVRNESLVTNLDLYTRAESKPWNDLNCVNISQ